MLLLQRALAGVCVLAGAWSLGVALTGGFFVRLGPLRVSSRDPWTALVIAIIAGGSLLAVGRATRARVTWRDVWTWWAGVAVAAAIRARSHARVLLIPGVAVAVVGAGVDIAQWLRDTPLWVDEEMIALNVRDRSFGELPGTLWLQQSAPLGWLVAERAAVLALGTGELALRLVPLLFGLATLAAAAWVGARWMGRVSAGLLVLLVWIGQWLSHFRFEVKHYSADAFAGLLLPALAAWTLDTREPAERARWRWTRWWAVAALLQWFGNGAALVTPACATFLFVTILRRHGAGGAARFAAAGLLWLVSFGAHYELSLQYTHHSRYLRSYWAGEVPPAASGLIETAGWIANRLEPLATNPGGTALAAGLWGCAAAGFALGSGRMLGALFATVPLTAFALAALRLVPLHDRFSLWVVPALYVGIALLFDAGLRRARAAWSSRRWAHLVAGVAAAAAAVLVSTDIVRQGYSNLDLGTPRDSNHAVDDRSAVRWLMHRRQPGDVLMSTRLGWPAIWWYGGMPVRRAAPAGRLPDGSVMYEIWHETLTDCGRWMEDALSGHTRVLFYVGFPDVLTDFRDLLLAELSRYGRVADYRAFTFLSRAAVIELHPPGQRPTAASRRAAGGPPPEGCVGLRPARRR